MDESSLTPFFPPWKHNIRVVKLHLLSDSYMLFTSFASFPFKYVSSEFFMKKMGLLLKSSNHNCSYIKSG